MPRRGRSLLPARAGLLFQVSHPAGQCRRGNSTQSYTTSAPAVTPDRRRQRQAPLHAAGAAVATRCGQGGNRRGMLSASRRREAWNVELVQGLTWTNSTTFAGKRDSFMPAPGLGLLSQLHLAVPPEAEPLTFERCPPPY